MSVAKRTEMCVCMRHRGIAMGASRRPCEAPIERCFPIKFLYILGNIMPPEAFALVLKH